MLSEFFLFKQKTAYEMRISDWSSDVCSSDYALRDDADCIANIQPHPTARPWNEKKSIVYPFTFPAQDFKLRVGDKPLRSGTLEPAGEILEIDEDERFIALKLGPSRSRLEAGCSLIPEGPVGDAVLRAAVHRYAQDVAANGRSEEHT